MKQLTSHVLACCLLLSVPALGSAGSYFDWNHRGNCFEFTPEGKKIQIAARKHCRKSRPSHFAWDNHGKCFEWTPENYPIKIVSGKLCRKKPIPRGCGSR